MYTLISEYNFNESDDNESNLGGLKLVSLISGGIDSPAAAHLFLKKNIELVTIYFQSSTFSDPNKKGKALESIEILSNLHNKEIKAYIIPHAHIIGEFLENCPEKDKRYTCIFCRRMMFRIAERVVEKESAEAIVTGESLGQVASQTLDNISITSDAIDTPVLRPLLGMDKDDIIEKIAKKIGTFEITSGGSSCRAVPEKPEVFGSKTRIERIEKNLGINLNSLITESLENSEEKMIKPKK